MISTPRLMYSPGPKIICVSPPCYVDIVVIHVVWLMITMSVSVIGMAQAHIALVKWILEQRKTFFVL